MSEKRFMNLTVGDFAVRLDLIAKVHGIEQAENYFNNISKRMRTIEVFGALLNCYAHGKCVDKADAVMQKIRESGYSIHTINYNVLLNLYYETGNIEKLYALLHEMEEKKIKFDRYTYGILLNTSKDIDDIEKILMRIESDVDFNIGCATYTGVANQFLKAGIVDKALESLRKAEKLVAREKKKNEAYSYLITYYAKAGKKEEVLRLWNKCKNFRVCNRDYYIVLCSILKFDDIETAEEIFEEWKASNLSKDIRVPNILIGYYCRKGLVEKAEGLKESMKLEDWAMYDASMWYWLSLGYVQSNQMLKAVQAMESGLLDHIPGSRVLPDKETMVACLKCLKEEGNVGRSGDLVRLLKDKGIVSEEIHHRLLAFLSGEYANEDGLFRTGADGEPVN